MLRALIACALLLLLAPGVAHADPPPAGQLVWNEAWPRFRPIEYGVTAVAGAGALTLLFIADAPQDSRWRGGVLFDDGARDALRVRSPAGRDAVRDASHVTAATAVLHVALIDSLLVPVARGSGDVAQQLSLMNAESFAIGSLVTTGTLHLIRRERPPTDDCRRDPSSDPLCGFGTNASFPSGHSSTAFTAAGLACAHHAALPLYGGGVPDALACGFSLTLAASTAFFRVLGDRHYVTDVLAGGSIGFLAGWGLPALLHYRPFSPRLSLEGGALQVAVLPTVQSGLPGAMLVGAF